MTANNTPPRWFVMNYDPVYGGGWGWLPTWFASAISGGGAVVSHDVLDHLEPATGSVEQELLALGAALLVRCESGLYAAGGLRWSDADCPVLASALAALDDPAQPLATWPSLAPARYVKPLQPALEAELSRGLANALRDLDTVWRKGPAYIDRMGAAAGNVAAWLRRGYRRAQLAYRGHTPEAVGAVALALGRQAERDLAERQAEPVWLRVAFDRPSLAWRAEVVPLAPDDVATWAEGIDAALAAGPDVNNCERGTPGR